MTSFHIVQRFASILPFNTAISIDVNFLDVHSPFPHVYQARASYLSRSVGPSGSCGWQPETSCWGEARTFSHAGCRCPTSTGDDGVCVEKIVKFESVSEGFKSVCTEASSRTCVSQCKRCSPGLLCMCHFNFKVLPFGFTLKRGRPKTIISSTEKHFTHHCSRGSLSFRFEGVKGRRPKTARLLQPLRLHHAHAAVTTAAP